MAAKFFIYRNLHRENTFSIRLRGKVVDWQQEFVAKNVHFKVNQTGRAAVLSSGHKNVHAFVVAESYEVLPVPTLLFQEHSLKQLGFTRVSYNPRTMDKFQVNGVPITTAEKVLFTGGGCYVIGEPDV